MPSTQLIATNSPCAATAHEHRTIDTYSVCDYTATYWSKPL